MKNYKVLYKETNIHHFIVPAKSKQEAIQHIKDRIYWDLESIDETSDEYSVKHIEVLKKLPINLEHENTAKWWERVKESRKKWLESIEEERFAKQEEENNKLRTDF